MRVQPVERLPFYRRKEKADIQRLVRDFIRSRCFYAHIEREGDEYPNGGKLESALKNAIKRMELDDVIDVYCIGNEVYLKLICDREKLEGIEL